MDSDSFGVLESGGLSEERITGLHFDISGISQTSKRGKKMQYDYCAHDMQVGDEVLLVYPAGDADSGKLIERNPGVVTVATDYPNNEIKITRAFPESVSHLCICVDNDDEPCDLKCAACF